MRQEDRRQYFMSVGINYDNVVKYHNVVTRLIHALEVSPHDGDGADAHGHGGLGMSTEALDALLAHMRDQITRAVTVPPHHAGGGGGEEVTGEAWQQLQQQLQERAAQLQLQGITGGDELRSLKQLLAHAMALPAAAGAENARGSSHSSVATTEGGADSSHDLLSSLRQQATGSMYGALMLLSIGVMITVKRV
jgi:hypothetical protein